MKKERKLISYGSLNENVLLAFNSTYPDGIQNHVIPINVGKKKPLYAVRIETEDAVYLVKVEPSKFENKGKPTIDQELAVKKELEDEDEL